MTEIEPQQSERVRYDAVTNAYYATYDESPSTALVTAVAEITGADEVDLTPLYGVIEPDALDALFDGAASDPVAENSFVRFRYEGFTAIVWADGDICIQRRESPAPYPRT